MVRISNPNPKFNWTHRTEHLQKIWLLDDEKTKRRKNCNIDLGMVVRARQNYFSPINGKTSKYCTAVRIFNRDRSCEGITELNHTFFVLVISIAKSNQSSSFFAFYCLFWRDAKSLFCVIDEEAEKCYIHNMFRVNKVSTKQDIWNFGKATKKSRFS